MVIGFLGHRLLYSIRGDGINFSVDIKGDRIASGNW